MTAPARVAGKPTNGFIVEAIEPMRLRCRGRLANMYVLSPFVWRADGRYHLMVRAVPRRDDEPRLKMAEIWYGAGSDGLTFDMDEGPVIFPGPDAIDLDGCEDPTVLIDGDQLHVWYTGWNQAEEKGRLLRAAGPHPRNLEKQGIVLDSTAAAANPKESTIVRVNNGGWRLFYEFAADEASQIGLVAGKGPSGPWTPVATLFEARKDKWDGWHLSTGPIVGLGGDTPIMFYNGASRDAHWRIGWIAFDADFSRVVARGEEPIIVPPATDGDATDIAFAASAIERDDCIWLYYSLSDRDILRARMRRL